MDLDSEIKKVRNFMNDMHAIFPGGADGLKAAAAQARDDNAPSFGGRTQIDDGGPAPIEGFVSGQPGQVGGGWTEKVAASLAMGRRLEELLPQIEQVIADVQDIAAHLTQVTDAVSELQRSADAKGANAGAAALGGASGAGTGTDVASGTGQASTAAPIVPATQDPSAQGSG